MKDAKGHGSDPRGGAHATGVDKIGRPFWGTNPAENLQRAQDWFQKAGYKSVIGGTKAVAAYDPLTNKMHLNANAKFWQDPASHTADESEVRGRLNPYGNPKKDKDTPLFFTGRFISANDPEHMMNHEVAHAMYRAPEKFADPSHRAVAREEVSGRASHSPDEFVAEVHAGMKAGRTYSDNVMQMFKQYAVPRKR